MQAWQADMATALPRILPGDSLASSTCSGGRNPHGQFVVLAARYAPVRRAVRLPGYRQFLIVLSALS
jgi:hypothetical protein